MEDLGKKLFYLRTAFNLTQAHVAKKIGVSASVYLSIEKNASSLSIERLNSILSLYGITLQDFFAVSECDLLKFMKGETPAIVKREFLPVLLSKLEAIMKLLQMLVQNSFIMVQNQSNQRKG